MGSKKASRKLIHFTVPLWNNLLQHRQGSLVGIFGSSCVQAADAPALDFDDFSQKPQVASGVECLPAAASAIEAIANEIE